MSKSTTLAVRSALWLIFVGSIATNASAGSFTTLNLASEANDQLGLLFAPSTRFHPAGEPTILGGVPFDIPSSGNDIFNSDIAADHGPGTVTLTVPVNLSGVTAVDTLINTGWGQPGPSVLASLTFFHVQRFNDLRETARREPRHS